MTDQTPTRSLQDVLDSEPSFVDYLYSNRKGSVLKDAVLRQPPEFVSPEFTTWRDEQQAWRNGIAFYDQSFHMTTTYLRGPDALKMVESLAVNSFDNFDVDRARHIVCASPDGYLVSDGIIYRTGDEELALVGRQAGHNWIRFNAEQWGVPYEADEIFSHNPDGRRSVYRYQIEGPDAPALYEQLTGTPLPKVPWSQVFPVTIAGHNLQGQLHTMAGNPGCEFFGPWDEGPAVKEAILTAGADFDLKRVGSLAYFTNALELGWIPRPLPAIFTHDDLRPFREWLPATASEATWGLGGSLYLPEVQDYYFTPWEIGYGNVVKFDHDFIGREALEQSKGNEHRKKVTLIWDPKDVAGVVESYMHPDDNPPPLYIELPRATYATWQFDTVKNEQGETVGASTYTGFIWNERSMLSLAVLDPQYAEPGTRVSLVWGEPDGGTKSKWLEPHRQVEIRATVAQVPIGKK